MGRVLVTGATGFLGGHVARALGPLNVVALGRDPDKCADLKAQGFDVLQHDLRRPLHAVPNIEAIVHCAALSSAFGPYKAFKHANVDAVQNVVDLAKRLKVRRLVHISSPTIYFKMADRLDLSEDALLPRPINHYAATKRAGEDIIRSAPEVGAVILRPRGIYGPGDTTLLPTLLRAAQRRPFPMLRGGAACIDLTHVEDVVRAVQCALKEDDALNGQVFNISGGEVLPIRTIVDQTCVSAGVTARWRNVPLGLALGVARMSEICASLPGLPPPTVTRYTLGLFAFAQSLDISKARTLMDWTPQIKFAEGLANTIKANAA